MNLEASGDLAAGIIIGSQPASGAGAADFTITDSAAGARRFYRILIP